MPVDIFHRNIATKNLIKVLTSFFTPIKRDISAATCRNGIRIIIITIIMITDIIIDDVSYKNSRYKSYH